MSSRWFGFRTPRAVPIVAVGLIVIGAVLSLHTVEGVASTSGHRWDTIPGITKINHIIIIEKENRSFDEMFGTFPGADGATRGTLPDGTTVPLVHEPDHLLLDIDHSWTAAQQAVDGGKMDGFSRLAGAIQNGKDQAMSQFWKRDIPGYWQYAKDYTLDDHFFSTMLGPSFPNRLASISGTFANTVGNPINTTGASWGCDAGPKALVAQYVPSTSSVRYVKPCFNMVTMPDLLQKAGVSWRYYSPTAGSSGYGWNALDYVKHDRYGSMWRHVIQEKDFQSDVKKGRLPSVSWMAMPWNFSEHPPYSECVGELWSEGIINSVMKSPDWKSSVIIVTWDDFGGFYDHEPPPVDGPLSLGPRVPALIISPYSVAHTVDHTQYDFRSIFHFIEQRYNLTTLTPEDATSNSISNSLNFMQKPLAPHPATFGCSSSDRNMETRFFGSIVSVAKGPTATTVVAHVPKLSTDVNFEFKPSLAFETNKGKRISLLDGAPGDAVIIKAEPTPIAALDYQAKLGIDSDLNIVPSFKATVSAKSADGQTFSIAVKGTKKYTISLATGPKGLALGQALVTAANLQVGSNITLAGVVDSRFKSFREVSALKVA